jgi:hypothetical protein
VTTFLDWRIEPGNDVTEEVSAFVRPASMSEDGKAKYRIQCYTGDCKYEELYDYDDYSDDEIDSIRYKHVDWHNEGCPE